MIARAAIDGIGYTAATMTTISFVPQLVRVIKLRSARDVSLGMFLIFTTGTAFWLLYGLMVRSFPVALANSVTFVLSLAILVLKLKFDRDAMRHTQPGGAPR